MPYISPEGRDELTREGFYSPKTAGDLNFMVTSLVLEFLGKSPDYQKFNDAVGALEGAKLELYRRSVSPYEDRKIKQNGDLDYPWKNGLSNNGSCDHGASSTWSQSDGET